MTTLQSGSTAVFRNAFYVKDANDVSLLQGLSRNAELHQVVAALGVLPWNVGGQVQLSQVAVPWFQRPQDDVYIGHIRESVRQTDRFELPENWPIVIVDKDCWEQFRSAVYHGNFFHNVVSLRPAPLRFWELTGGHRMEALRKENREHQETAFGPKAP
ncbi:hypothetical protein BDZ89DRAFT_1054642 [Hymenopellis radicata]|nr:hypothetical protein BDZ89DRAFT_1054642 [Hymenopellis radicata]